MLRIYQRMWQVNWAEQWQYRANLLMYLLFWLVSPIVFLSVWTTVANSQGAVQGLTANDFSTYYLTLLIVDNLTTQITIHLLANKIQDGTLSGDLLKPVPGQLLADRDLARVGCRAGGQIGRAHV